MKATNCKSSCGLGSLHLRKAPACSFEPYRVQKCMGSQEDVTTKFLKIFLISVT